MICVMAGVAVHHFGKKGEAPWDNERIVAFLKKLPDSEPFIPAAVTALGKNGAELLLANMKR